MLKYTSIFPVGCWNLQLNFEKEGKTFACIQLTYQMLQSLSSERAKCKNN